MRPLLVWSQDDILAHRSGYHVLADYLEADRVVTKRSDPSTGLPLLVTRVMRRFAFSRWYSGGSREMEQAVRKRCREGFGGLVHLLWCDRDLGFLDYSLDPSKHPLIGTFHQCPDDLPQVIRRPSALRKFAAIIMMSESQRPYFRSHGVPDERLHRVLHGVDVDHFTPQSLAATDAFTVLAVGGTRRNFPLMRAVAEALQDHASITFDIVGPPDKEHVFQGLRSVRYHCRVSDDRLLAMYRQASCFLHLAENATANNAMLEALACGVPVVSQRVGGIPEYLTPECSLLSATEDDPAVVKALRDLAASASRQHEMRLAARAHALTLDWRITARATTEIYHRAA